MDVSLVDALVVGSFIGGVVCLALAGVAWRHRDIPAALPFAGMMLAVAGWAFADAAFFLSSTVEAAYVAETVMRSAGAQVPPLWVLFVLAFAGYDRWLNWRTIAVLWSIPLLYVLVTVTAPLTGLASTPQDVVFLTTGGISAPVVGEGVAHDLHLLFAYAVVTVGFGVLLSFLVRSRAVYRKQTAVIGIASVAPVVVNAVLNLGLTPHPGIDLTPVAFAFSAPIFGAALVKYDFLTVTPMTGDVLVDELPDPVFLVGEDGRIVDFNPAAAETFGLEDSRCDSIDEIDPGMPPDVADGDRVRLVAATRSGDDRATYFECSVASIEDQYGNERNELVVFRDITGQQQRQRRLEALQEATRQFLTASTDEEIAEIGVEYADEVLDTQGSAVFLDAGGTGELLPVAWSDSLADVFERGQPPSKPIAATLQRAYTDDESTTQELPGNVGGVPERALAVPLGDYGVLWIGTRAADVIASDDEGFATILARTTQVALTRVERESDLRRSRSSVERRSEQIAFFNGVLRHRLRNALLIVQGRADHLRDTVPDDQRHHLQTIEDWCDDLTALSEEIRAVHDTVTATESERLEVVDLSQLIVECVRGHERTHPAVDFDVDVDAGLRVQANDLAARVVESVVENAIVHHDGDEPQVAVWTVRAADRVQVHVADDGPGMDDDLKSTVFERDLTTSETASGFGLYFVSVLMNLYGGTVWFEDNHPRGTVAVIEFQVAEDEEDVGPTDAEFGEIDAETD